LTDLGILIYAEKFDDAGLTGINGFIRKQDEIFLRLGLTQNYKAPDGREGYWLQVNGIYTFPDFLKQARSYL